MDGVLIFKILLAVVLVQMILGVVAYLILLERKTAAWIQDRLGPNRVGPQGLLQPIADGIKFILKEEFIPKNADRILFLIAPIAILTPALCGFAMIPWGGIIQEGTSFFGLWAFPADTQFMVSDAGIGILFILAMAGLGTYGIVLGGWSSGSKFSFLGGLRATAQMLSYEVPMALSIMTVLVVIGTLSLATTVENQAAYFSIAGFEFLPKWNIFIHPVAFLIFCTCVLAEANRAPFDLPECESELVGGYHTEYSSMKFACFFLAEYAAMITGSAVMVALFLGGWHLPWLDKVIYGTTQPVAGGWFDSMLKFTVVWAKIVGFCFFYMWIRWTIPRFRFDQLMNLAWRGMIPLALAALLITATVVYLNKAHGLTNPHLWIFVGNIVLLVGAVTVLAVRPKLQGNKRVPIRNSRYNPQFAKQLAAEALDV